MSSGSFLFACVFSGAPSDCRVYSGSYGLSRARLEVVGIILVRVGSFGSD